MALRKGLQRRHGFWEQLLIKNELTTSQTYHFKKRSFKTSLKSKLGAKQKFKILGAVPYCTAPARYLTIFQP